MSQLLDEKFYRCAYPDVKITLKEGNTKEIAEMIKEGSIDIGFVEGFVSGAEIIKEVANKTNDQAGDGTTTATVLTQALVNEGLRQTTMGLNSMAVRAGMEHAAFDGDTLATTNATTRQGLSDC